MMENISIVMAENFPNLMTDYYHKELLSYTWLLSGPIHCSLSSSSPEISRGRIWSVLPFPSPENLPDPGIETRSPAYRQILCCLSHEGNLCLHHYIDRCLSLYTLWFDYMPFWKRQNCNNSLKRSVTARDSERRKRWMTKWNTGDF